MSHHIGKNEEIEDVSMFEVNFVGLRWTKAPGMYRALTFKSSSDPCSFVVVLYTNKWARDYAWRHAGKCAGSNSVIGCNTVRAHLALLLICQPLTLRTSHARRNTFRSVSMLF